MSNVSLQGLIGIYKDLEDAVFFNQSTGEFLVNDKYTPEEWMTQAESFLASYQGLLLSNTTLNRHDYILREEYAESEAELAALSGANSIIWDREKARNGEEMVANVNCEGLDIGTSDEPFEGYFELEKRMVIPAEALRITLEETGGYLSPQKLPMSNACVDRIGDFVFIKDKVRVIEVQLRERTLKATPQCRKIFYYIMQTCYGNEKSVSIEQIGKACDIKTDDKGYNIRRIVSSMNGIIRRIAKLTKKDTLIVAAPETGPNHFKINYNVMKKL